MAQESEPKASRSAPCQVGRKLKSRRRTEYEAFCDRAAKAVAIVAAGLVSGGHDCLQDSYRSAIRFVFGILGAFILESRDIGQAFEVCRLLREVGNGGADWRSAHRATVALGRSTGVDLLRAGSRSTVPTKHARAALKALTEPDQSSAMNRMYFASIPSDWLTTLYERLLNLRPEIASDYLGVRLISDSRGRKRSGSFFTPPYIVDFIVSQALGRVGDPSSARVLDPSMGAGDFLLRAMQVLSGAAEIAENCLYGCDIDPIAVDIARFLVWLEAGGKADARKIARHLITADALAGDRTFRWQEAFPDVFQLLPNGPGFDAVVGNPPYVASKNGMSGDYAAGHGVRGQSDYYLLFLESVLKNELVKRGGSLAMVLPDPFLVRGNATRVRRALLQDWRMESIVHISGAFPAAHVANIILICSNRPSEESDFPAIRLDKSSLRDNFKLSPKLAASHLSRRVSPAFALSQPKAEVLYLVDGEWRRLFERIHGPEMSIARVVPPYVFLKNLGTEAIFRGEEIGKWAITASDGELPILLGGESIHRYGISWEGRRIARESVAKPLDWYCGPKIVLQKSSARVVAVFDREGYVVPQSVYGIKLRPDGHHPLYLLAVLNSKFMSEYVFRAFTGYKLVQPQIELEDVRALPIRRMPLNLDPDRRASLADEGLSVFEEELSAGKGGFSELAGLVDVWLSSGLDDAVHDLLARLAEVRIRAVDDDNDSVFVVIDRIERAIDAVVDKLYGWQRP